MFLPIWQVLLRRWGKPRCFIVGLMMLIPSSVITMFLPPETPTYALHLQAAYGGAGISAVYLLPWAMLPDVIDESHLDTGRRREAVFYSYFVFLQKFASGIAIGMSTLVLDFGGYISEPCCGEQQPPSVRTALQYMMSLVPAGLYLLSLGLTTLYPLTPERCVKIKDALDARRRGDHETAAVVARVPGSTTAETDA